MQKLKTPRHPVTPARRQAQGGPVGPLARHAAQSPAVQRLQGLQRKAAGPVVQRVLDHNGAIVAADVASVTKLAAKVFMLTGQGGEEIIIKFEIALGGEHLDSFAARDDYTRELANLVLAGVPGAQRVTPADLGVLQGLAAPAVGGDVAAFAATIAPPLPPNILVLKAQKVHVGTNFADRMQTIGDELAGPGGMRAFKRERSAFETQITQPAMMQSMGRMAAYDLIINNGDRFRADGTINLVNLDLGGGAALGIDNLDPNNRIDANMPAGVPTVSSPVAMFAFANKIVAFLRAQMLSAPDAVQSAAMRQHFMSGMVAAVRTLKAHEGVIRPQIAGEPDHRRRQVMTTFANRLQALPTL